MSSSVCLHAELAAVIERLVLAAVTELQRLTKREEEEVKRLDTDTQQHTMVQFASVMETLGNEALGKILSILDTVAVELKLDKLNNPPPTKSHVLYILQGSRVGVEHSYGAGDNMSRGQPIIEDHCYGTNDKTTDKDLPSQECLLLEEQGCANAEVTPAISVQDKSENRSLTAVGKKRTHSNKTKLCKSKIKPQDTCSQRDSDMSEYLIEDRSEEEPVNLISKIKCENEDSSLERAEEMHDSVRSSPETFTLAHSSSSFVLKTWCFNCTICGIDFSSEFAFRVHMSSHTVDKPFKCPTCDSSFNKANSLKMHMYKHTGDYPFKCPECGKGYADKDKLKGHLSIHTGQKPFACKVCGNTFTAKTNLHRHMRSHSGTKPYTCSECGRGFTRSRTLKDHMTVHSGVHPFKCSFCNRSFNHKVNLIVHERIHTGERPYVCSLCSKAFRTTVALHVHQRVHTGEKPYICDVCGRAFSQQSSLCVHKRVHLNERSYICHTCNKSFNNPQNLKLHVRVHSGERPYVCELCDKTFVQNAHLRTHTMHMHSGVKQCMCEHCGKVYADRRTLRVHKCVYK
ncbi:hypothetical protein NL108_014699 [Boleophthalmus pectinirostris]|uniref:zinc finger protein ZFP2-like n=1 Tax=Boleophthalmus pectinirostris TaxID=150288 RepID=UPI000A1C2270|nr:zinc finger protein ZFP2-like [Boleophthalmus pectinirostris]KAJ0061979.1 hypothetical protein NL108_014699 [Boleophthalmus pectinirostris]